MLFSCVILFVYRSVTCECVFFMDLAGRFESRHEKSYQDICSKILIKPFYRLTIYYM